jgi:hypothetical protein
MRVKQFDKIVIGAGLYGLYAALHCAKKGERVLVLEYEDTPFKRASYINQARVHMGYHYPRSYSTAIKSARYFNRFNEDYGFCIHSKFEQVYATSTDFTWTNSEQFTAFCRAANIRCDEVAPAKYFKNNMCDGAFLTEEYTYDALILKNYFVSEINKYNNVKMVYGARLSKIEAEEQYYTVMLESGAFYKTSFLLNVTYAATNQILQKVINRKGDLFKIKYELCELILCDVDDYLKGIGITVMDGPFFSIMPFGKTGFHSLTSVTFTPHLSSYNAVPTFRCQENSNGFCSISQLGNCNDCPARPESAWPYMSNLANKYLLDKYAFRYNKSLYSMKPILKASEIDDSRPTVIRFHTKNPTLISVLSGKINTVYDLDEVLADALEYDRKSPRNNLSEV